MNNKSEVCTHEITGETGKSAQHPRRHPELSKISSQKTILESEECEGWRGQDRPGQQSGAGREEGGREGGDPRCEIWSAEEERLLVRLHNEKGNRWVEIAQTLGKSDNAVKNHYHSKLRKGLRKINAAIALRLHPHRVLKNNILSKIIQAAEESLASGPAPPRPEGALAFDLKNGILRIAELAEQQTQSSQELHNIRKIMEDLTDFNRNYRKKGKAAAQPKPPIAKYKGKEIKNLLEENCHHEDRQHSSSPDQPAPSSPPPQQPSRVEAVRPQPADVQPEGQMVVIINPSFLTPVWVAYCPAPKLTSNPRASSFSLYQPPADSISWHLQSLPQASRWGGPSFLAHPL